MGHTTPKLTTSGVMVNIRKSPHHHHPRASGEVETPLRYVDANRRGEYFCSYGLPPLHGAFLVFLNEHCSEWSHNAKRLQSPLSNVCGQYCIAYLVLRCNGIPMKAFVNRFGSDLVANDCRVFDWVKTLR